MTQEEKQLLLKDLCARLPYHTIVKYRNADVDLTQYVRSVKLTECKPYLRPMSTMTEEEKRFYKKYFNWYEQPLEDMVEFIDWLNAHYFDYRGLIPRGLALPALEGMYNI